MTPAIALRMIQRRWYVAVFVLAMTAWACVALLGSGRTYWAQGQVVFVEPGVGSVAGVNDGLAPSLINFAGVVQRKLTYEGGPTELPSSGSTLYGSGVRSGYALSLLNSGSQWAASYSRPVLELQVTGSTPENVRRTLDDALMRIRGAALGLQEEAGAPERLFIGVEISPSEPEIIDVGSTDFGRKKGLTVIAVVGFVLAGSAAYGVDALARRWGSRRRGPAV